MKFQLLTAIAVSLICLNANALSINNLVNDKEIQSKFVQQGQLDTVGSKIKRKVGSRTKFLQIYKYSLQEALTKVDSYPATCGFRLVDEIKYALYRRKVPTNTPDFESWLHVVRNNNTIDDIFAQMLSDLNRINYKLKYYEKKPAYPKQVSIKYDISNMPDILNIYKSLDDKWADGKNSCVIGQFEYLSNLIRRAFKVKQGNDNYLYKILISSNLYAYNKGLISRETWNKLEVLRHEKILTNRVTLDSYLDLTLNAKNKLTGELKLLTRDATVNNKQKFKSQTVTNRTKRYLTQNVYRHQQLTRRDKLYQKYSSQQVLLLADILVKAAKRMNAFKSEIRIFYEDDSLDSADEIYQISPMEQYRMSLKMLRKDYANTSISSLFSGVAVEYEDIVMAALESGVIGFDEIDYVVQYESFWVPKKESIWAKVRSFVFGVAGTASFYLPTPFNIIGAIGLVFTESLIHKRQQEVNADNNTNSIF